MQNSPEVALRWLEEAVLQAASDGHVTIKESQVQQVLKQVKVLKQVQQFLKQVQQVNFRFAV